MHLISDCHHFHDVFFPEIIEDAVISDPQFPGAQGIRPHRLSSPRFDVCVGLQMERDSIGDHLSLVLSEEIEVVNRAVGQCDRELRAAHAISARITRTPRSRTIARLTGRKGGPCRAGALSLDPALARRTENSRFRQQLRPFGSPAWRVGHLKSPRRRFLRCGCGSPRPVW